MGRKTQSWGLLSLPNINLGDASDLQKWLVALAVDLHNSGLWDQRSRKLADIRVRHP